MSSITDSGRGQVQCHDIGTTSRRARGIIHLDPGGISRSLSAIGRCGAWASRLEVSALTSDPEGSAMADRTVILHFYNVGRLPLDVPHKSPSGREVRGGRPGPLERRPRRRHASSNCWTMNLLGLT